MMLWLLASGFWLLASRFCRLSGARCPFLSLSSRRRRSCSRGRCCSKAARGRWTTLAQIDDVDRLESAGRWNVIAFFGDAIRWSYRRSPSVFRKPHGHRTVFRAIARSRSRPDSDPHEGPSANPQWVSQAEIHAPLQSFAGRCVTPFTLN